MGRLPKVDDFPSNFKLDIVPPPKDDSPENILILLHGLGDTHASFTTLARNLSLPETACISLSGPAPLLDLGGFHWGDDIIFSTTSQGLDPDAGFEKSTAHLTSLYSTLLSTHAFTPGEIFLLGFGQGASAALHFSLSLPASTSLGGVISISGPLPSTAPAALVNKNKTPIIVCSGTGAESSITPEAEEKLKRVFEYVEIKRYRRPGDGMPSNRDEMMPIMEFFARRLRSKKGVPKGSVEIK